MTLEQAFFILRHGSAEGDLKYFEAILVIEEEHNRQKAEIEVLKEAKEKAQATAMGVIKRQDAEIERLKKELEEKTRRLKGILPVVASIKENTIKEFAERLQKCSQWLPLIAMPDPFVTVSDIDNLVKEMVGAESG